MVCQETTDTCQEVTEIDTPGVYWSCYPMVVSAVTSYRQLRSGTVVVIDESGEGEILDPDIFGLDIRLISLIWNIRLNTTNVFLDN